MHKSKFGKELYFIWKSREGIRPEDIHLRIVPSTLQMSDDLQKKIHSEWTDMIKKNPLLFDSPKWRTEFVNETCKGLEIYLSPIMYSQHNVMRKIPNQVMQFYPNPLTVNTVQVTSDNYILLGVKGKGSDQKGIGLMGAGFVERYVDKEGNSKTPEMFGYTVQKECLEETRYDKKFSFNMVDAKALAVMFGSNHDTTIGFHLPIFATSKEISINNNEHDDIIFLPDKYDDIYNFLKEGGYKGIPASDHALGCIEAYDFYKFNKHNKRV
ncbi:MAG: hypothetical protein ACP5NW_03290 [Candidatus Woesearchaeota archaeon]